MKSLLVAVLFLCILLYALCVSRYGQGEAFTDLHQEFVADRQKNYNPIGLALISADTQGTLGTDTRLLNGTFDREKNAITGSTALTAGKSGLFEVAAKCEALKTTDCSAFNDESFAKDCGICIEPDLNSKGEKTVGGRVLLNSGRMIKGNGKSIPDYRPTVGSCPANRLVSKKDECLRLTRQLECEKGANYGLPGCAQCYSDATYSVVDTVAEPGLLAGSGTLHFVGKGTLIFYEIGYKKNIIKLGSTPAVFRLNGPQMTQLSMSLTGTEDEPDVELAGYLSGSTATGQFNVDIQRIILVDSLTGRKPRQDSVKQIDGIDVTNMVPGFGQTGLALLGYSPFTFVDPKSEEAGRCQRSPFITTAAASEFMDSDPCYSKKGSSLECLQNLFLSGGCLVSGKGYPKSAEDAATLMRRSDGSQEPFTLSMFAKYIYTTARLAATGVNEAGNQESVEVWSAASEFCTGNKILSPCDTATKDSGPLSTACLNYLWLNKGAGSRIGPTYTTILGASSLFPNTNQDQFCTPAGTLAPISPDAIKYWKAQGGVKDVIKKMKTIHEMANTPNSISDAERSPYINQCYGNIPLASVNKKGGCEFPKDADVDGVCGRSRVQAKPVIIRQNCDSTTGWAKPLGLGSFVAGAGFPGDSSYIVVPAGFTAVLTSGRGDTQKVVGPAEFNFCSRPGFNDNVKSIIIS